MSILEITAFIAGVGTGLVLCLFLLQSDLDEGVINFYGSKYIVTEVTNDEPTGR